MASPASGRRPRWGATQARSEVSTDVIFTAYALPTQWHPIAQLHDWPLDHTCVATSSGLQWGCFGRTYAEDPSVATAVASGPGDDLWAKGDRRTDGYAGIDYGVTGVCDQCSNRILLPAGLTVKNSPGNEIATLLCGIYGLHLAAFVTRVKDAAAASTRSTPAAFRRPRSRPPWRCSGAGLKQEWELVRANNERLIAPVLGAQYAAVAPDIEEVYLSLYYKREALTHAWERGNIDKAVLVRKVSIAFVEALSDLRDVVGAKAYAKIVPVPPQDAADYVFYRERGVARSTGRDVWTDRVRRRGERALARAASSRSASIASSFIFGAKPVTARSSDGSPDATGRSTGRSLLGVDDDFEGHRREPAQRLDVLGQETRLAGCDVAREVRRKPRRRLDQIEIGLGHVPDIEEFARHGEIADLQPCRPAPQLHLRDLRGEGRQHEARALPRPRMVERARDHEA